MSLSSDREVGQRIGGCLLALPKPLFEYTRQGAFNKTEVIEIWIGGWECFGVDVFQLSTRQKSFRVQYAHTRVVPSAGAERLSQSSTARAPANIHLTDGSTRI